MASHASKRPPAKIRGEDFERLLREALPRQPRFHFKVEDIRHGFVRIRLAFDEGQLRPGGTIGGPIIFTLADTALYAAVMSVEGMLPLAVTTDMTIHFLRKPRPADLIAEARLLKRGRKLVVGDVLITSDGAPEPVAHVTGTYALPTAQEGALVTALREGERDFEEGRVITHEEMRAEWLGGET